MKKINHTSGNLPIAHELVKAKEIINEFVYSCSHTMRGPLKSITGLVNLLHQSIENGKGNPGEYLNMIGQSVNKMEDLLNQLEQFLENSKNDLTCEPINIQATIDDVLLEVKPEIDFFKIQVSQHIDQTGYFYSDIYRFRLILFHLISNAINFSDQKKENKSIRIDVRATSASCSVEVIDDGIGINPDVQSKIFDLFYRGSEKSPGSGVGLYIVGEILKKMGGSISVNSTLKKGSNFFVWLPSMAE